MKHMELSMHNFWTKLIVSISLLVALVLPAAPASAQLFDGAKSEACKAGNLGGGGAGGNCTRDDQRTLQNTIATIINLLTIIVGIIAVIMIVVGGLRYVLSDGDSAKVNSARSTILYALIGAVIAAFAQIIVRYVLNAV